MNQHKYIANLLLKHVLDYTKPVSIPITSSSPLSKFDDNVLTDSSQYKQVVFPKLITSSISVALRRVVRVRQLVNYASCIV